MSGAMSMEKEITPPEAIDFLYKNMASIGTTIIHVRGPALADPLDLCDESLGSAHYYDYFGVINMVREEPFLVSHGSLIDSVIISDATIRIPTLVCKEIKPYYWGRREVPVNENISQGPADYIAGRAILEYGPEIFLIGKNDALIRLSRVEASPHLGRTINQEIDTDYGKDSLNRVLRDMTDSIGMT